MPADVLPELAEETKWHTLEIEDIFDRLDSHEDGLSSDEIGRRQEEYGENVLESKPPTPGFIRFLEQFRDPMVYLLLVAAFLAFFFERSNPGTPIFICIALTLNAFFGYLQESRAEQAMESLKRLLVSHTIALRDGTEHKVSTEELVPGDVVFLDEGLNVPADCRLISVNQYRVDESSLTGESDTIHKAIGVTADDSILQEQDNMVFMGTVSAAGRARAIVVRTGMDTELGSIASGISDVKTPKTPLEIKLESLGRFLGWVAVTSAVLLLSLHVLDAWFTGSRGSELYTIISQQFLIAVAIFVAIVPEGLPIILVITLAMGMRFMARQKAIVRRMKAVETLGSTTIICTDKTGTLTRNEMTVRAIFINGESFEVTGRGFDPTFGSLKRDNVILQEHELAELHTDSAFRRAIACSLLCQNSNVREVEGEWVAVGDPTDSACAVFGWKMRESVDSFRRRHPRFREFTFDRVRKRMTTIHEYDGERWMFSKGALGPFISLLTHIFEDGELVPIKGQHKDLISEANLLFASRALRVLALVCRKLPDDIDIDDQMQVEQELVFLGLVGIMDPPRPEVKDAIEKCHHAGIQVMMITGDQRMTAMAVGREIGIVSEESVHMSGKELRECSDEELDERLHSLEVFSRVTPDQKLRIVERLQSLGHIVAMTGDGDNDAPALSQANIGVAMGISGTDVARDASDMVLQDDNFSNIVAAVEEGRKLYQNIRNFVRYQISTNVAALLLVIVSSFIFGWNLPLTATQLLVINILMDGPPAVALGIERRHSEVMDQPPRPIDESLPNSHDMMLILFLGLVMVIGTSAAFYFVGGGIITGEPCSEWDGSIEENWFKKGGGVYCDEQAEAAWMADAELRFDRAQTVAFTLFIFFQLFNVLNCRSKDKSIFAMGLFNNKAITISIALSASLLILIVSSAELDVPFIGIRLGELLSVVPLEPRFWVILFAIASTVFWVEELRKLILARRYFS
jgi:Ca2+-transporting ATPase